MRQGQWVPVPFVVSARGYTGYWVEGWRLGCGRQHLGSLVEFVPDLLAITSGPLLGCKDELFQNPHGTDFIKGEDVRRMADLSPLVTGTGGKNIVQHNGGQVLTHRGSTWEDGQLYEGSQRSRQGRVLK